MNCIIYHVNADVDAMQ